MPCQSTATTQPSTLSTTSLHCVRAVGVLLYCYTSGSCSLLQLPSLFLPPLRVYGPPELYSLTDTHNRALATPFPSAALLMRPAPHHGIPRVRVAVHVALNEHQLCKHFDQGPPNCPWFDAGSLECRDVIDLRRHGMQAACAWRCAHSRSRQTWAWRHPCSPEWYCPHTYSHVNTRTSSHATTSTAMQPSEEYKLQERPPVKPTDC